MTSPITQEIDELEKELGTAAIQLMVTFAVILLLRFGLGIGWGRYDRHQRNVR